MTTTYHAPGVYATCDQCTAPAVTQVTIGPAYGLYCHDHGRTAEQARMDRIRAAHQAARRAARWDR